MARSAQMETLVERGETATAVIYIKTRNSGTSFKMAALDKGKVVIFSSYYVFYYTISKRNTGN